MSHFPRRTREEVKRDRAAQAQTRASGVPLDELVRLLLRTPTWRGGSRVPRKVVTNGSL